MHGGADFARSSSDDVTRVDTDSGHTVVGRAAVREHVLAGHTTLFDAQPEARSLDVTDVHARRGEREDHRRPVVPNPRGRRTGGERIRAAPRPVLRSGRRRDRQPLQDGVRREQRDALRHDGPVPGGVRGEG